MSQEDYRVVIELEDGSNQAAKLPLNTLLDSINMLNNGIPVAVQRSKNTRLEKGVALEIIGKANTAIFRCSLAEEVVEDQ